MARVSVVVANYNYGKYISRTLDSLMNQSIECEVIVVDDGSTDDSVQIISTYDVRLIKMPHLGQAAASNEGFRNCKGQYIVRVDSDDYVHKDFVYIESLFLEENKDYVAVSCDYYRVDELGNRLGRFSATTDPIACGVMFRKEVLFDIGLYNPQTKIWEEREFLERFNKKYKVHNIELPLYRYLYHEGSLTNG